LLVRAPIFEHAGPGARPIACRDADERLAQARLPPEQRMDRPTGIDEVKR
jgi:hypothetical protein